MVQVRHLFTHFELRLAVVAGHSAEGDGWWQPIETLDDIGLPTLYRRAVEAVLAQRTLLAA